MSREERIEAHRRKVESGAAERLARHDAIFADEYVDAGGDMPVSTALLKALGYSDDDLSLARVARGAPHAHACEDDPPKGQAA